MAISQSIAQDVQTIIRAIEDTMGAFLRVEAITAPTRELLRSMLSVYGVTDADTHRLVDDKDLVSMYATARGNAEAGARVAQRIAVKYGTNPLLDPVNPNKPATKPSVYYPAPTPTPSTPTGDYATKQDIRDVRQDMAREIATVREQTVDTCLKLAEAMPGIVTDKVAEAIKAMTPVTLQIQTGPSVEPANLGLVHHSTSSLIRMLSAGVNVYLHGPAGSGKTTAGRKAAEAFKVPFYFAAKVESEYMLLGFKDARGETVRTQFRDAYEHGGVFLFDELDASSPSAVVAMNAALANGVCPFPDTTVMRHSEFRCIAAGNTKLTGASRQYVGRAQLDAASIDRFAFLEWQYDDALEVALSTDTDWCGYVQAARKAVADRGLPHLITPRATYDGCRLLAAGLTFEEVADAVVWKGLDRDTVDQVVRAMPVSYVGPASGSVL